MSRRRRRNKKTQVFPSVGNVSTIAPETTLAERICEKLAKLSLIPVDEEQTNGVVIPAAIRTPSQLADHKSWALAQGKQNQQYYLKMAAKNGNAWFQNPKEPHQYSEFVTVTPQMCKDLLANNANIRPIAESDSDVYARDITNDRWFQTDESITIDLAHNMINGQHRADGVVKAGIPCTFYFTWNVPTESRFVKDSGRRRSVNEKLRMVVDANFGNKLAALCRAMMRGTAQGSFKFSESEIAEFAMKHEAVLRLALRKMPRTRADVQAVVAKAILWYGEDRVNPFCERFNTMVFRSTGDPVGVLYRWLVNSGKRAHGSTVYRMTLTAIENFIKGKEIRRQLETDFDIFEWETGWGVPSRAPSCQA